MVRVSIHILGISELKWTGMDAFNSDDHYIYYCGQESFRRNGVALLVNQRVWNAVLGCDLKNNRMISVCFQGKQFNITVIQGYASTTKAKKVKVEWFCEDLQDLLELTPKNRCSFHHRGLECRSRNARDTWSNRQIWLWSAKWSNTRDDSAHGHHQMVNTEIRLIIFFEAKDGETLYSRQKQDLGLIGSDHQLLIGEIQT